MEAMEISLPWCLGPVIKGHENSLAASYDLDVIITVEVRISRHEFDRGRSTIRCGGEIHAVKSKEPTSLFQRILSCLGDTGFIPIQWFVPIGQMDVKVSAGFTVLATLLC